MTSSDAAGLDDDAEADATDAAHALRGSDREAIEMALNRLDDVVDVGPRTEFDDLRNAALDAYDILAEQHPEYAPERGALSPECSEDVASEP